MAEVDIAPNFGAELKDGFKNANAWVGGGIQWLDDIQAFYRERAVIEKDYSAKLAALAKKYFDKKLKKSSSLSVGDTPTVTPGSLESASMTTWTVQLSTLESRAAEHERFSQQLVSGLAEPLKNLAARYEDLRKQHEGYATKLEKERDSSYGDLKKTKGKYDSVCQEVENKRKKIESSFDHGKTKVQGAYVQQQADMRNTKNTYLITINVTNKQKERYYYEYVPELLDALQALSEARTATLNNIWSAASTMETQTLDRSLQLMSHLSSEIPRNNPVLDSMMFVRHNALQQWQPPSDFVFEPSPVWLDDNSMASDPQSRTFLMNILSKSKSSLGALRKECEAKRREVDGAKRVRQAIREGKDKRDEVEVVRSMFVHSESLHEAERRRVTAEVEVETITAVMGDISVGMRAHRFENKTFKIPTNCDLCSDRIWGLSAKGLSCMDCGYTCHLKCELKVPADCPGELDKDARKAAKAHRQVEAQNMAAAPAGAEMATNGNGNGTSSHRDSLPSLQRSDTIGSMNTLSSGYAASAHRSVSGATVTSPAETKPAPISKGHRVMAPPPAAYRSAPDADDSGSSEQKGKMLYAYTANGDGEISVAEGIDFAVVESDDGSGWLRIRPLSPFSSQTPGLVPTSYTELQPRPSPRPISTLSSAASNSTTSLNSTTAPRKQGPAVAPRRGKRTVSTSAGGGALGVKYVEALYTYEPSGDGETGMTAGERLVLIKDDEGDGWCTVRGSKGDGVVPAGWVKAV
ncbi:Protein BZZ1 [Oleoguttula sp. CCFEE 5521]